MTIILNFDAFQRKSLKTKFGYRYFFGFLRFSQKPGATSRLNMR